MLFVEFAADADDNDNTNNYNDDTNTWAISKPIMFIMIMVITLRNAYLRIAHQ